MAHGQFDPLRQHDGGHTDRPTTPGFVDWANAQLGAR